MEASKENALIGIVTSRMCPTCGHHELGVTTEDGTFLPLRPGTRIEVLEGHPAHMPGPEGLVSPSEVHLQTEETEPESNPWVPDPVKGDRSLRLKYGVMIRGPLVVSQVNGTIFQAAYLEKLRSLIEREIYIPVTVILDRFFAAPNLASGDPKEVALRMWDELEEIREPVKLVKAWLENPNEENLIRLIQPKSKEDMGNNPASEAELEKELATLSLEEFLNLL